MRGDAAAALDLLLRLGESGLTNQLWQLRHFAAPPVVPEGGRNAPCSCGSGRKRKLCCPLPRRHPLPARAAWLWTKTRRYLQTPPQLSLLQAVRDRVWSGVPDGADGRADCAVGLSDPLVLDVAAFEGGLLRRFAARRGPLLPEDESASFRRGCVRVAPSSR